MAGMRTALLVFCVLTLQTARGSTTLQRITWNAELLRKPAEWYATPDARAIADSVVQFQSPQGAWPKNTDLATPPRTPQDVPQPGDGLTNTIDNGATTMPMQFLALVHQRSAEARYRDAFGRGLKYLLEAQYPNGGWPQFYPLRDGYYSRITFNDNAMVNVLELLRAVAAGTAPYAFVDEGLRRQAAGAVDRGIDVILRSQLRRDGRLTAWCAQYDEQTLAPAWARNYEPPSLSGSETVGIVRFLMAIERPPPAVVSAIDGAVAWLESVKVRGKRVEERTDAEGRDRRAVDDPSAPPLWARFYDLETNRPIFLGRDRVVHADFNDIERERRAGYAYYGTWPARLLADEYPRWRARVERPRVLVSTDIGGTDPDDFQSMVHFLLYADMFDVEGIVSSPYGPGRRSHVVQVIDDYAADYPNLKRHSDRYPDPEALRRIAKQGATEGVPGSGVGARTEGSDWIVQCARRADARPLWVLVWGGIDDLAQALHDAPDIAPRLRVYFIGGPNKMWSVDAYNYIEAHHPGVWMIEANSTYRGWFVGGDQSGERGNRTFVTRYAAGAGSLGRFFSTLLDGTIKMGDSPSVAYLLRNASDDPTRPGWGGRFVPVWDGRKTTFTRLTTDRDTAEAFGVVEFALPVPAGMARGETAQMVFDGRIPAIATREDGVLRFRFSPRDAKVWPYVIRSSFPGLDGQSGQFTAVPASAERTSRPSTRHPRWWIDDPDPAAAEGVHAGARHVSRWRAEFLQDFAERLLRTRPP